MCVRCPEDMLTSVRIKCGVGLGNLHVYVSQLHPSSKGLIASNLVVDASFANHGDEDVVGLAHNVDTLSGNFAQNPDTQAGAREWVPADELLVNVQLTAKGPDFILEPNQPIVLALIGHMGPITLGSAGVESL